MACSGRVWSTVLRGSREGLMCLSGGPSICHPCALEHAILLFFFNSNRKELFYSYGILRNRFRYSFCNCPKYLDIWILNPQKFLVQKFSSLLSPWKTKQGTKSASIILPLNTWNSHSFVKLPCTISIEYNKHCALHKAMCRVWNCLLLQFVFLSLWKAYKERIKFLKKEIIHSSGLTPCCNIKLKLQSSVISVSMVISQHRHACDSTVGTSIFTEHTIITHYEDSTGIEI